MLNGLRQRAQAVRQGIGRRRTAVRQTLNATRGQSVGTRIRKTAKAAVSGKYQQ